MKFLILGATGMAGHMIALYLKERGHNVAGTFRNKSETTEYLHSRGINLIELDVTDESKLASVIAGSNSDVVVNCVGLLNAECDKRPDLAVYLNTYLPHRLAFLTSSNSARVIHISTDCVFAGNTGPYSEASIPDGTSLYDRTKALGELNDDVNLTLRQSIVGPDPDPNGIGLLNWFMQQVGVVNGWSKAIWTGLTTLELAKAVESCAASGVNGLINMIPTEGGISKYSLLRLFNDSLRKHPLKIDKTEGLDLDKTLIRTRFDSEFVPIPYAEQIEEMSSWIKDHARLYPSYYLEA